MCKQTQPSTTPVSCCIIYETNSSSQQCQQCLVCVEKQMQCAHYRITPEADGSRRLCTLGFQSGSTDYPATIKELDESNNVVRPHNWAQTCIKCLSCCAVTMQRPQCSHPSVKTVESEPSHIKLPYAHTCTWQLALLLKFTLNADLLCHKLKRPNVGCRWHPLTTQSRMERSGAWCFLSLIFLLICSKHENQASREVCSINVPDHNEILNAERTYVLCQSEPSCKLVYSTNDTQELYLQKHVVIIDYLLL